MVGNHKGVHPVVLRQIRIGFLEFMHLLWVEDVDFSLEPAQAAILTQCVNKAVTIDGGGLQADYHIIELHGTKRRHDSL